MQDRYDIIKLSVCAKTVELSLQASVIRKCVELEVHQKLVVCHPRQTQSMLQNAVQPTH